MFLPRRKCSDIEMILEWSSTLGTNAMEELLEQNLNEDAT